MPTLPTPAPARNRIALLHAGIGFRIEDVPPPALAPDEVLVRVQACAICGSEINDYHGFMRLPPQGRPPMIFGHEAAGTVEAVGAQVHGLHPGERIAVAPNLACNVCELCRSGHSQFCGNRPVRTVETGGGYAELMTAKATQCHRIPDGMSFNVAASIEPVACCLHTYSGHVPPRPGERVLILGGGLNAQVFVQVSRIQGASLVALCDTIPERLAMAKRLGADLAFSSELDPRRAAPELADGVDVVVVTRAKGALVAQAVEACRIGGRVLVYGLAAPDEQLSIRPRDLVLREIMLIGSCSYVDEYPAALALLASGRIRTDVLVTHSISLEAVASGFAGDLHRHFKTVLRPNGGEDY